MKQYLNLAGVEYLWGKTTDSINAETTRAKAAEGTLQTNINNEAATRKSADDAINASVTAEMARAKAAEEANATAISTETTNRGNADTALQTALDAHKADTSNPHNVTKAQVGLDKVDNTADADKVVASADKLTTSRKIWGQEFDGTADVSGDITLDGNIVTDDPQLVDLGLPSGTLWMDRNVGANSPEDAGLYFAWGETTGYTADEVDKTRQFTLDNYKYNVNYSYTKYNSTDGLTTLETTDDAVLQNIHKYSMPTKEQLLELINGTTSTWTTQNGVKGKLLTSKTNGNSIFVPAAGRCTSSLSDVGSNACLWSSSLHEDYTSSARFIILYSSGAGMSDALRHYGQSVRGVATPAEGPKTYTLPSSSGTLALTSDVEAETARATAKEEELLSAIDTKQPKGDYLTEHQDLSNYATLAVVSALENNIPSLAAAKCIPYDSTITDHYQTDKYITAKYTTSVGAASNLTYYTELGPTLIRLYHDYGGDGYTSSDFRALMDGQQISLKADSYSFDVNPDGITHVSNNPSLKLSPVGSNAAFVSLNMALLAIQKSSSYAKFGIDGIDIAQNGVSLFKADPNNITMKNSYGDGLVLVGMHVPEGEIGLYVTSGSSSTYVFPDEITLYNNTGADLRIYPDHITDASNYRTISFADGKLYNFDICNSAGDSWQKRIFDLETNKYDAQTIPVASKEQLGVVKVGDGLNVDAGVISVAPDYLADMMSYGVEWDVTVADPTCTRIGNPLFHKSLPVQSQYKGCVVKNGELQYFLDPNDWSKKADGTASVLDGTDGDVMVRTPKFYGKSGSDGDKRWVRISTIQIDASWVEIPELYVSAYRNTIYTDTDNLTKVASVVNTTANYRGGINSSSYDTYLDTDLFRTMLGKPRTNISRATMRTYAKNAGQELLCYEFYKWIFYWAYVIEYANFNSQAAFNAELTSDGYHQGGLGAGVTTLDWSYWDSYNSRNPITPCGYGNAIGNYTGTLGLDIPETTVGSTTVSAKTLSVPRWRGFDNPFGDIWTNLDGIVIKYNSTSGYNDVYTTTDASKFGDDASVMSVAGLEITTSGYIKKFSLGETGEIIPFTVGGSESTYKCDYCYANLAGGNTLRVGGDADGGGAAGLGGFFSDFGVGYADSLVGFRSVIRA